MKKVRTKPTGQKPVMRSGDPRSYLSKMGHRRELISVWKLSTGDQTYEYFANNEGAGNYRQLADYNFNGKNPLETADGDILTFRFELTGPDNAPVNLADDTVREALVKLVRNLRFVVKKDTVVVHDGRVQSVCSDIPHVVKLGSASIAAVQVAEPNVANRMEDKKALYLPMKFTSQSETLSVSAFLPSDSTGFRVPAALANYLVKLHIEAVQYPKGRGGMQRSVA